MRLGGIAYAGSGAGTLPFLNPAEWLWRNGEVGIRRTLRRPAKSYFRKIMFVCESLENKVQTAQHSVQKLGQDISGIKRMGVFMI